MTNRRQSLLHPRDEILQIMQRIYRYRMTTTSGGNLSIRDENGDIWITPARVDKGSLRREDIVCVHPDGRRTACTGRLRSFPFIERSTRRGRDIGGIVHAHSVALVAFSISAACPTRGCFTRRGPSAAYPGLRPMPCREARPWRTVSSALSPPDRTAWCWKITAWWSAIRTCRTLSSGSRRSSSRPRRSSKPACSAKSATSTTTQIQQAECSAPPLPEFTPAGHEQREGTPPPDLHIPASRLPQPADDQHGRDLFRARGRRMRS